MWEEVENAVFSHSARRSPRRSRENLLFSTALPTSPSVSKSLTTPDWKGYRRVHVPHIHTTYYDYSF